MADALMHWDDTQKRWRAMYKGRWLRIRASKLVAGATTATETTVEANRRFREWQAQIDRELAVGTLRPNEGEYLVQLESIQVTIKSLQGVMRGDPATRPMLAPKVEVLKQKEAEIKQRLLKPTLPPLDDTLRNPLNVSPERVEGEAIKEATQEVADRLREQKYVISDEELRNHEDLVPYDEIEPDDFYYGGWAEYQSGLKAIGQYNEELKECIREDRIQEEAQKVVGLKDELLVRKKKESGLIESEFERGQITQLLKEHGADVPESRQLKYHIDKYFEYQRRRQEEKKIAVGRMGKIIDSIKFYRKWSSITCVTKIGEKTHIDAYYTHLSDKVIAKKMKPRYAQNLFAEFKGLITWLVDEAAVLSAVPACLQRKRSRYTFKLERQTPQPIPLKWTRKILDAANSNPRLKLCILLTLNCGFGASEIGQLTNDEYNPKTGRITHKRCKTEASKKVPTVCYKLWDETKALLDQEIAKRTTYPVRPEVANLLLVNNNGSPLWSEYVDDDGEPQRSDNITCAFKRLVAKLRNNDPNFPKVSYYRFRKTSATLIGNKPRFKILRGLWLGHAPETTADEYYVAPHRKVLDRCITWLHDKIFGVESVPPEDKKS